VAVRRKLREESGKHFDTLQWIVWSLPEIGEVHRGGNGGDVDHRGIDRGSDMDDASSKGDCTTVSTDSLGSEAECLFKSGFGRREGRHGLARGLDLVHGLCGRIVDNVGFCSC